MPGAQSIARQASLRNRHLKAHGPTTGLTESGASLRRIILDSKFILTCRLVDSSLSLEERPDKNIL